MPGGVLSILANGSDAWVGSGERKNKAMKNKIDNPIKFTYHRRMGVVRHFFEHSQLVKSV